MPRRYAPTPVPQDDNQPLRAWLDDNNRRIAAAQPDELVEGFALLYGQSDPVVADDTTETPILNFTQSFASQRFLGVDPVLGTITLPDKAGLITISSWVTLNQVTVVRNITVQLMLEVNGVWGLVGAAYIPQIATDVDIGISAGFTREVAGGEVFRWGLLLDGGGPATFNIIASSFEVTYATVRG